MRRVPGQSGPRQPIPCVTPTTRGDRPGSPPRLFLAGDSQVAGLHTGWSSIAGVAVSRRAAALRCGWACRARRCCSPEAGLRRGINRLRWIEYSFSATIMIVLIGFYFGLTGITTVTGVIGANIAMILFGWLQERMNPPGRAHTTMLPFWFGTLAGAAPWVAITINLIGARQVPGLRHRYLPVAAGCVLQLRDQPVAAIPPGRAVAGLRLRREGLPRAQPYRQIPARMADLRRLARLLTGSSAGGKCSHNADGDSPATSPRSRRSPRQGSGCGAVAGQPAGVDQPGRPWIWLLLTTGPPTWDRAERHASLALLPARWTLVVGLSV